MTAREALEALLEYDRVVRLNTTDDYDAIGEVIKDEHGEVHWEIDEATPLDLQITCREGDETWRDPAPLYLLAHTYRKLLAMERGVTCPS